MTELQITFYCDKHLSKAEQQDEALVLKVEINPKVRCRMIQIQVIQKKIKKNKKNGSFVKGISENQ